MASVIIVKGLQSGKGADRTKVRTVAAQWFTLLAGHSPNAVRATADGLSL